MDQDLGVDAQMVLMDALRVFDERERDRANGKEVPSFEALYADVFPAESAGETKANRSTITADDLGLADIDRLEKKIPRPVSEMEIFDPVEIHRQKIRELLFGFSSGEQEAFVSFLRRSVARKVAPDAAAQKAGKAVVLFSGDELIRHSPCPSVTRKEYPYFQQRQNGPRTDRLAASLCHENASGCFRQSRTIGGRVYGENNSQHADRGHEEVFCGPRASIRFY
jgi:hypothetical protein